MAEYIYIYMNKIVLTMSKIKHTSMKIWNEQNIYISDRKEKNKHEGEIKDIIAWMYPSMKEYFRIKEVQPLWDLKYVHLRKRNS